MAVFVLNWEVAGDVQLRRAFTGLAADLDDYRDPLRQFGDQVVYPETRKQFQEEGEPAWPELSPAYRARKERVAPGAKIMHLSGALEESLTDKNAVDALYTLTATSLEIGTEVRVGRWNLGLIHQKPVTAPVPPRKMLRLGTAAQTRGIMIFSDWIADQGRKRGLGR